MNGTSLLEANGRKSSGIQAGRVERKVKGKSDMARKIKQSIAYRSQHLNQSLKVATLAAAVNISPSHYSAVFKRLTGLPPIDFLIHLRMEHASRLFDSTSLNVKEVAAAVGYTDPFYFSRLFKSINRLAPTEYRQKKTCECAAGLDGADLACNGQAKRVSESAQFQ